MFGNKQTDYLARKGTEILFVRPKTVVGVSEQSLKLP